MKKNISLVIVFLVTGIIFIYLKNNDLNYHDFTSPQKKSTLKLLQSDYSTDNNSVYYKNIPILLADLNTFKVLGDGFAEDKNHLFEKGQIIFNLKDGANPFQKVADYMSELVPKDENAIDAIGETYYTLTLYDNFATKDIFSIASKTPDDFFEPFYKNLKQVDKWSLQKFPPFRLAFIVPNSPATSFELPLPTGNSFDGKIIGRKILSEDTILAYGSYYVEAYRGPAANLCKKTTINIDKFIFKKTDGKWMIHEINRSIDHWIIQSEGSTEDECTEINQDKIKQYQISE